MSITTNSPLEQKIDSLVRHYERQGYVVLREPKGLSLPFDLGSYRPDLVARKGDEGLIIEVKASTSKTSIDRFQTLAEAVRERPGWRFLLVTLQDLDVPEEAEKFPSWEALSTKLDQVRALVAEGLSEAAALYVWAIFEAAMRKRAVATATPVERLPATGLMNHLYTLGHIAVEDFDTAKYFLALRNRIAHGFGEERDYAVLDPFVRLVARSLEDWSREPGKDTAGNAMH